MRVLLCLAVLLPAPALADTLLATSTVTAVTVYPQGAQITRQVRLTAPPGPHDVLITDLPGDTVSELIRLAPLDGVTVGAFSLRTERLPPRDPALTPKQTAAKAEIDRLEGAVRAAQAVIDGIEAQVAAAEAQVGFLQGVRANGEGVTVQALREITQMIGVEVLAARQAALTAGLARPAAEKALADAGEALVVAQAVLAALAQRDAAYAALTVAVEVPASGRLALDVTHYVQDAYWEPVYDLSLTRKPAPALTVGRGALISQASGEDWAGVQLTLSTAQPSAQAAPSGLWPDLRRIGPEVPEAPMAKARDMAEADSMAAPVMEPEVVAAQMAVQGDVVVYTYPGLVDVATGVEDLRLTLDELALLPEIEARAVPRSDTTAFVLATFTNTSGEILLPGEAFLLREGTLVGSTYLDSIAPGDEAEVAFGAIEAVRLKRDQPLRSEGDRGILTTSRQVEESAVITVENLGDESWTVHLLDQVPYSEQEDLEITYAADPAPDETDVEGQRGVLGWTFDLPGGETKKITLDHVMQWPDGMVLQ